MTLSSCSRYAGVTGAYRLPENPRVSLNRTTSGVFLSLFSLHEEYGAGQSSHNLVIDPAVDDVLDPGFIMGGHNEQGVL
jgi:hypothetical protein